MHRTLCVLVLLILVGCQGRNVVDDNPVIGPPPPRKQLRSETKATYEDESPLQLISKTKESTPLINRLDETIVARVSGVPVFAADVVRPFRPMIETERKMLEKIPAESQEIAIQQLEAKYTGLISQSLADYIDREVVLQRMHKDLKQDQLDTVTDQLSGIFDEQLATVMEASNITSRAELEALLKRPDDPAFRKMYTAWRDTLGMGPSTSISESQDGFIKMFMAAEYLKIKAKEPSEITRPQMVQWYREHADEFDVPLELKWQQIVVSHEAHGGKAAAREVMQKAVRRLQDGDKFDDVATALSDGASASTGGHRDWITPDTLTDSEIEARLFEMTEGQTSGVFKRDDRFEVVRVVQRRGGARTSFEDVQEQIQKQLLLEQQRDARTDALAKMRSDAEIEILFDKPTEPSA